MEDYLTGDEEYYYSSDQDSLDGLDNEDSDFQWATSKSPSSKVITKESLLAAQREDLQRVIDMLSIKEHHALTLLIHYRWDVEKLLTVLVEKGKTDLFVSAGVSVVGDIGTSLSFSSTSTCDICMEELPADKMTKMECGHGFCNDCWTEHFVVQINQGHSRRIRCMAHKCNAICDEAVVRNLVEPHSPCSCMMWELWVKKCRDVSETVNWITVYTKHCPKCQKPVEKNGGCNLVRCICGQAFCWLCGGATGREHNWTGISGHSCGSYKEDLEKKTEQAKRDLHRYTHYHNRYKAHSDSFKLESKLRESMLKKILISEEKESRLRDFSWVTNGLYRLFRSRWILSYSCPFAFYMFGEELFMDEMTNEERQIKQNLFEDQQQQLEANVEKLSKILEEPFDKYAADKVMEIRLQVINLSVTIDILCKKMYECIENELLESLQCTTHNTAPYISKGIDKASEVDVCWKSEAVTTEKSVASDCGTSGY
ncbi:hypothetical protein V6N13_102962 [Hibiscus sabdariffa]|uniref:RBR-type E3 ubiquitin transferase n=1 Tax=Hibiscus sabdariffa TaxID=183260 RepID=A0ABR2D5N4_9ROSI